MKFYDTNALLMLLQNAFLEDFIICDITLKEIENIKTSAHKDLEIKYKARRLLNLLDTHDNYTIVSFNSKGWNKILKKYRFLSDNPDSKIIYTAKLQSDVTFVTNDLSCKHIAKCLGLKVESIKTKDTTEYTGFKEVILSEEELANFYENKDVIDNIFDLYINQYLIIKDKDDNIIDKYKYTEYGKYQPVNYTAFESMMFGKIKAKDIYQACAMDSIKNNKITMVRGAAGTGKSYISFGYLFNQLESHNIDRIIIFCNTVATAGSAKLGYYPGSRDEKLLDSQIGNFLVSKLGDKMAVEKYVREGKIILLPLSDIRGFDTTGMNAGIYITEAQNLDIELMRLALQRIGEDSFCILDGDSDAQVDLGIYSGSNNGMRRVSEVFRGDPLYGELTLQNIHRSHIAELAQKL